MTSKRSLDQLERETEQNRVVLIDTVDALRSAVLGEVEAVRRKTSLDYIGSELRSRVRANPLRSFAIGAGLSVPLWKAGRRIPVPLLLVGAGVALARPTARKALSDAAADVSDRAARAGARSGDALGGVWGSARDAGASAGQRTAAGVDAARTTLRETANDALARAGDMAGAGGEAASNLAGKGAALLQDGSDRLADAREQANRKAAQTRLRAVDLFNENPLAVAGAGLALGALLAAILPATETEGRLVGKVAPDLKGKAADLVDKGYEAARAAAGSAYDGAVGRAEEHGLNPDGVEGAASDLRDRLGAVVDAAIGQHGAGHPNDADAHS